MNMKIMTALSAGVLLTACGGSGKASFDELKVELEDVLVATEGFYMPTPDAALPTGVAKFSGIALAAEENAFTGSTIFGALGSSSVTANFDDGTLTGKADGFYEIEDPNQESGVLTTDNPLDAATGTAIAGSFDYEMTQTIAGKALFQGTVSGALTRTDGGTFTVDETVAGYVSGDAAERFYIIAGAGENVSLGVIAGAE